MPHPFSTNESRHEFASRAVQAMRVLLDPQARAKAGGSQCTVLSNAEKQGLVDVSFTAHNECEKSWFY
jgi:hypothetical protein